MPRAQIKSKKEILDGLSIFVYGAENQTYGEMYRNIVSAMEQYKSQFDKEEKLTSILKWTSRPKVKLSNRLFNVLTNHGKFRNMPFEYIEEITAEKLLNTRGIGAQTFEEAVQILKLKK